MLSEDIKQQLERIQAAQPANEAEVETKILLHLFRLLGYTDTDRADKPAVSMAFGRERQTKYPDFILYSGAERSIATALVVVEAKAGSIPLEEAESQARSYSLWAGAPFYLVCNAEELRAVQFLPGAKGFRDLSFKIKDLSSRWTNLAKFLSRAEAILAKERLEYIAEYLPQVEHLPPRDFFQEYLSRLNDRFSLLVTKPTRALQPPQADRFTVPSIPVNVQISGIQGRDYSEPQIAAMLVGEGAKLLVTGAPGSGKSTMCKRVISALTDPHANVAEDVLPIYVRLSLSVPGSILEAFEQSCREMGLRVLPNLFRHQLNQARPMIILDGLDEAEVSDQSALKLSRLIHECKQGLLVATRSIGLTEFEASIPIQEFTIGEVRPLSPAELKSVLINYLADEEAVDSLLVSIPSELREDLRSPLFALMAIRVAQSKPNWTLLSRFELFEYYVNVLDEFFNAPTVRGLPKNGDGNALRGLSQVTVFVSKYTNRTNLSLKMVQSAAEDHGFAADFRALVNTGLLTGSGGYVNFAHQTFYDFGLAYHLLNCIRSRNSGDMLQASPTLTAYEFVRPELTPPDEAVLVQWLHPPDNPLRRRVLGILRYGASPNALEAVRALLREDLSNRIWSMVAKVLAENGDLAFLDDVERRFTGKGVSRRARLLANAMRASGRPEYYLTLKKLAEIKTNISFSLAFIQLALGVERQGVVDDIKSIFFRFPAKGRSELARAIDRRKDSPNALIALEFLLRQEQDQDVTLLLLFAGRDMLTMFSEDVLWCAASRIEKISDPKPHQSRIARRLFFASREIKASPAIRRLRSIYHTIAPLDLSVLEL